VEGRKRAMGRIRVVVAAVVTVTAVGLALAVPAAANHGTVDFKFVGCVGDFSVTVAIDGDEVPESPFEPYPGFLSETVQIPEGTDATSDSVLSILCEPSGLEISTTFGSTATVDPPDNAYTTSPPLVLVVGQLNETIILPPPTPTPEVLGKTQTKLASTGSDSIPLAQQGLGLVALGGLALFAARRRRAAISAP
jgi:MYXO-CTERM domain-containing protein